MPTLRKFFKHVAPKLIGESRYGSKTGKSGDNSKLPSRTVVTTSQSRRHRHRYSQFDAEEGQRAEEFALGPIKGRADPRVTAGHHGDDHLGWGDSDSEKGIVEGTSKPAIVQTKTVTVEYTNDRL